MSFTIVNEANIQKEIDKILNNIQCTPNLDDISKIRIFENVLNFMYQNRMNLKKNLTNLTIEAKKDSYDRFSDLFEKILKNEIVQDFIFEHGASDDLSDAKTYDDLKNLYSYSIKFIELMDRSKKKYSNMNSGSSYATGSNFCAQNNAISLGSNSSASNRIMSRCNDYGGIKSVDYPFNPF